jgi:hypothetical protein
MRLVQFKDGSWGVKKGLFSKEYLDISGNYALCDLWWCAPESVDRYCKGTLEDAAKAMGKKMSKTPIGLLREKVSELEKEVKRRSDGNMNDIDALYKYLGVRGTLDSCGNVVVEKKMPAKKSNK